MLEMWVHYALGASGGPAARLLMARGVRPRDAGLAVAGATSVLVDEVANAVFGSTPSQQAFPTGRRFENVWTDPIPVSGG